MIIINNYYFLVFIVLGRNGIQDLHLLIPMDRCFSPNDIQKSSKKRKFVMDKVCC